MDEDVDVDVNVGAGQVALSYRIPSHTIRTEPRLIIRALCKITTR